ncbi:hypothetical protein CORC01_04271 [Colletotrichum orchidophilum]|uniref:Uncharacterized protein n=1 Tax=Colletotrichum orchidophilum TaxID=1209926 RepID=A0A1G4BGL1_9PEZI|nr:uncharacterized protein CORC01_04271 [Colletotrichum orchidophilum]OHF00521.1 hypothetical protein CORC01_04271 [Colletotrichum orchidophilum]
MVLWIGKRRGSAPNVPAYVILVNGQGLTICRFLPCNINATRVCLERQPRLVNDLQSTAGDRQERQKDAIRSIRLFSSPATSVIGKAKKGRGYRAEPSR